MAGEFYNLLLVSGISKIRVKRPNNDFVVPVNSHPDRIISFMNKVGNKEKIVISTT